MLLNTENSESKPRKRCALYSRSATDSPEGKSIAGQLARLRDCASRFGWTVGGEYLDRAKQGLSLKAQSMLRLIDDAKAGKFEIILVTDLDRISRDVCDSHSFFQRMQFHDVEIYSLEDNAFISEMLVVFRSFQSSQYLKKR